MADLLVSVRSVAEAEAALAGGAAVIDVKEPNHGSLGRAVDDTIGAVCRQVGGRRPVSAALGELREAPRPPAQSDLAYVKWGLSGCLKQVDWQGQLTREFDHLKQVLPGCRPVAVSYADWLAAQAPPPHEVCAFACEQRWGAFLLDTWKKEGRTLLDWLSLTDIDQLVRSCRAAGVPIALAGSLGMDQINQLRIVEPTWFAVRGAVCRQQCRTDLIDANRVRALADLLGS